MLTTSSRVAALYLVMRHDAQHYLKNRGISANALSVELDIPDRLLRGMKNADWSPSLQTLLRIQNACESDPKWPTLDARQWRETGGDDGFVMRRIKECGTGPLAWAFDLWNSRKHNDDLLSDMATHPDVTITECRARDPREFMIVRHSPIAVADGLVDGTRVRLGEFRTPSYRSALMADYLWVKSTGEAQCTDVVWAATGSAQGAFFTRVLLPVADHVVSIAAVLRKNFTGSGSVRYSAAISLLEE